MNKKLQEKIIENYEFAFNNFNFYKVKIAMNALDWHWSTGKAPTINEMEENVYRLFLHALNGNSGYCSSGGFVVEIEDEQVSIYFNIEESISVDS